MLCALLLGLSLALAACGGGSKAPLRQLPVQLGRAPPPTATPRPTPTPVPPPQCGNPVAEITGVTQSKGPSTETHLVSGQLKSNCSVAVDLTLNVQWVDGPDAGEDPRAFATIRRVLPGEVRPFSEVVAGARGATRFVLSAAATNATASRRR